VKIIKNLVFVGGGHAHLKCISNLKDFKDLGVKTTLISPSEFLYYSGMGPGLLGGMYEPPETRFKIKEIVERQGGNFLKDSVIRIHPENQILTLASGNRISYDIASFDVGSFIPTEEIKIENSDVIPVKPIDNLVKARKKIESWKSSQNDKENLCILGGGPSGIELAGNLWRISSDLNLNFNITLITDKKVLKEYPRKVREYALQSLKQRGTKIIEDNKVKRIQNNIIHLENNGTLRSDLIFLAIGTTPRKIFEEASIPISKDSAMIVNEYLQSIKYPNIFGGGDCIDFRDRTLDKVGVYAVRENPILFHNIKAFIQEGPLQKFAPQKKYLLILNMGNNKGISWRGKFTYKGRLALWVKNFIDKHFMKKYQI